jgi:hypothetical protein
VTGQGDRTATGQDAPDSQNRTTGRRGLIGWLADTPDARPAAATPDTSGATPTPTPETTATTASGRPRKAERRRARRAEFFAARRNQAPTARARFEVAVDHLRAVATDGDLSEATAVLEQIAGRRP